MKSKEEIKQILCDAVDRREEDVFNFYESVYAEPEYGYKEVKTSAKFRAFLDSLNVEHKDGLAITGVRADFAGRNHDFRVALMGELDAIAVPSHKDADPATGAVHACGHAAQLSSMVAAAAALADTGIMSELDGDIAILATPAEEFIEIEFRNQLIESGKVDFVCGKAQMIKDGVFDDIDASIMQHTSICNDDYVAGATSNNNGFVGKLIKYTGKPAHAGAAPWDGINALNAAMIGLMAINMQRETFKDEDHIRIHPILTKGGDIVNTVPADVRIESYVRGSNPRAILDASAKMDRSLQAGADAIGAKVDIKTLPGDFPCVQCEDLNQLMYENLKTLVGDGASLYCAGFGGGSSDQGDVSAMIPSIQSYFTGATGGLHQAEYRMVDRRNAILNAAKAMLMLAVDLLYDGAKTGKEIKKNFQPVMTKEQYLREWGHIEV